MPPKAVKSRPESATQVVPSTCEQCGDKCEPKPYKASTGKIIYCCAECYGYGTDRTYSPSQSESSEDEGDVVDSEIDQPDSDDGDDTDETDD